MNEWICIWRSTLHIYSGQRDGITYLGIWDSVVDAMVEYGYLRFTTLMTLDRGRGEREQVGTCRDKV